MRLNTKWLTILAVAGCVSSTDSEPISINKDGHHDETYAVRINKVRHSCLPNEANCAPQATLIAYPWIAIPQPPECVRPDGADHVWVKPEHCPLHTRERGDAVVIGETELGIIDGEWAVFNDEIGMLTGHHLDRNEYQLELGIHNAYPDVSGAQEEHHVRTLGLHWNQPESRLEQVVPLDPDDPHAFDQDIELISTSVHEVLINHECVSDFVMSVTGPSNHRGSNTVTVDALGSTVELRVGDKLDINGLEFWRIGPDTTEVEVGQTLCPRYLSDLQYVEDPGVMHVGPMQVVAMPILNSGVDEGAEYRSGLGRRVANIGGQRVGMHPTFTAPDLAFPASDLVRINFYIDTSPTTTAEDTRIECEEFTATESSLDGRGLSVRCGDGLLGFSLLQLPPSLSPPPPPQP